MKMVCGMEKKKAAIILRYIIELKIRCDHEADDLGALTSW